MSRLSLFVLPIIAAVGMYFLVSIVFPDLDQLVALLIAAVTGWVVRWALGRLQSKT
jgi:xanthine/uracil permease